MNSLRRPSAVVRRLTRVGLACGLLLAAVAAGCATSAPPVRSRVGTELDPCADRLHEVCGHLLFYYSLNGTLPGSLADLKGTPSGSLPPLTCPTSGQPYVYNREGLAVPKRSGRLVLYDAVPSHSGMRWGILAEVAGEDKPLTLRVIFLPETPVFAAKK